ncbi:hypothetical protein ACFLY6_01400 [Candidatus Dependentiae bacterium]
MKTEILLTISLLIAAKLVADKVMKQEDKAQVDTQTEERIAGQQYLILVHLRNKNEKTPENIVKKMQDVETALSGFQEEINTGGAAPIQEKLKARLSVAHFPGWVTPTFANYYAILSISQNKPDTVPENIKTKVTAVTKALEKLDEEMQKDEQKSLRKKIKKAIKAVTKTSSGSKRGKIRSWFWDAYLVSATTRTLLQIKSYLVN